MFYRYHYDQDRPADANVAVAFRVSNLRPSDIDSTGLRYVASIVVWVHWLLGILGLFEIFYRPYYGPLKLAVYLALFLALMAVNGYVHYLLVSNKAVTWRWIFALCAMDVATISVAVAMSGGFAHYFMHLLYYPSLALFAAVFSSFRLNMAWATLVCALYLAISLTAGDGIDLEARDEKALLVRLATMYAVMATVNLVSGFERGRLRQAVERERVLQRDRIEFSQNVHDTTAQSAYMIGLGIDSAKALAGNENPQLVATLEATSQLSRTTMWELRHPINMGRIYEGGELGRVLRSHATSFMNITSVSTGMTQTGVEPPIPTETKGLLFSIAHNALTNAHRHAEATRVSIDIEFGEQSIRLSVSDDGVGLPGDYAERGNGFANMSRDAELGGGVLLVQQRGPLGGTTVTCEIPSDTGRRRTDAIR